MSHDMLDFVLAGPFPYIRNEIFEPILLTKPKYVAVNLLRVHILHHHFCLGG